MFWCEMVFEKVDMNIYSWSLQKSREAKLHHSSFFLTYTLWFIFELFQYIIFHCYICLMQSPLFFYGSKFMRSIDQVPWRIFMWSSSKLNRLAQSLHINYTIANKESHILKCHVIFLDMFLIQIIHERYT